MKLGSLDNEQAFLLLEHLQIVCSKYSEFYLTCSKLCQIIVFGVNKIGSYLVSNLRLNFASVTGE